MKFEIPHSFYPFEHRWLETREYGRLHYIDEGSGRPLLLCHGNPSWSFVYRKMVPLLRDKFRCVAVDLPGFGLSEPAPGFDFTPTSHSHALESVVEHLDLRDLVVVGQDWGGPTGLGVAGRQPDRIFLWAEKDFAFGQP